MALLAGALATAAILGVTHAAEPDHLAGIAATAGPTASPRRAALVGGCFGAGHAVLVVAWLAVGSLVLETVASPGVVDRVGTAGVALVLGLLGAALAASGLRALARAHAGGAHGDADPHLHLPVVGGDHDHGLGQYLATGVLGALFTLSPPLSMFALAATLAPRLGAGPLALAVAAYAVVITASMAALGAGVGALSARLDGRAAAGARVLAGVVVAGLAVAVAVGLA